MDFTTCYGGNKADGLVHYHAYILDNLDQVLLALCHLTYLTFNFQNKYVTDTVAPRLTEIQPPAVESGDDTTTTATGKPFPPLQNSPEVTATGTVKFFFLFFESWKHSYFR